MDQVVSTAPESTTGLHSPAIEVIKRSFDKLICSYFKGGEEPFGGSTVCVAVLDRNSGRLDIANLGDSAAMLYRKGHLQMMSRRKQSKFNAPLQLTLTPSGEPRGDPEKADHQQINVHSEDCLIMATDGLFDNLFVDQIEDLIHANMESIDGRIDEENLALDLLDKARLRMLMANIQTPFSQASEKAGHSYHGGKKDDATVIIARIHRTETERL